MDDSRIIWIVQQALKYFDISDEKMVEEFITNEDDDNDVMLRTFLNKPGVAGKTAADGDFELPQIILYKTMEEEEIEIELPESAEEQEQDMSETGDTDTRTRSPGSESDIESSAGTDLDEDEDQDTDLLASDSRKLSKVDEEEGERETEVQKRIIKETILRPKLNILSTYNPTGTEERDILFIFRLTIEPVPEHIPEDSLEETLLTFLEFQYINIRLLSCLHFMLGIFLPMIIEGIQDTFGIDLPGVASSVEIISQIEMLQHYSLAKVSRKGLFKMRLQDDLQISLQKFINIVMSTINQIEGDIRLEIPTDVPLDVDPMELGENKEIMLKLENACWEWIRQILLSIEHQNKKVPVGMGPLVELDYWRERYSAFSTIMEQTQFPNLQKILHILIQNDITVAQDYQYQYNELSKLYSESKDNVRFLSTLERLFKNIVYGRTFHVVIDTIPSLLNSLRMVWIISRNYNRDDRMVPLMERIAWQLQDRVLKTIDIRVFFKNNSSVLKKTLTQACKMFKIWKDSYYETRALIESGGRDARWEFDRKKLFHKTDYYAGICQELLEIAEIQEEFQNIFGPQLRSVLGDPRRIDTVLNQLQLMLNRVEKTDFDIFDEKNSDKWREAMNNFRREVSNIESEAINFIDESFKNLRSAEGALDVLLNFQKIKFRDSINNQMMKKFGDILIQYSKELDLIENLFRRDIDNPALFKNYPPIAGSIFWERNMFYKIKYPMLRFLQVKEMASSDMLPMVKSKYLSIGRQMRDFEEKLARRWRQNSEENVANYLKKTVLKYNEPELQSSGVINVAAKPATMGYSVDFSVWLVETIREAKHMETLAFQIPEMVKNLALQEESFINYCYLLKAMISRYSGILGSLEPVETSILTEFIKEMDSNIQVGTKRLNWTSLSILDYIHRCNLAINKFESIVNQVKKYNSDIYERLQTIFNTSFFNVKELERMPAVVNCREYYQIIEKNRMRETEILLRKYRSIPPILLKVEAQILQTSYGKAPVFQAFYNYWEKKIYYVLVKMILLNLTQFNNQLMGSKGLFKVHLTLSQHETAFSPSTNDILKLTMNSVKECVEVTKHLVRWMHGTCLETPPQKLENETYVFTFYTDVSVNRDISEAIATIHTNVSKLVQQMYNFSQGWRRYRSLWTLDKQQTAAQWAQKDPNTMKFDEKLYQYNRIAEEMKKGSYVKLIGGICVDFSPLTRSIENHAHDWVENIGQHLHCKASSKLSFLSTEISTLAKDLQKKPSSLDDLKSILLVISHVREMSLEVEMTFWDVEEEYRTLLMHRVPIPEEEIKEISDSKMQWDFLYKDSNRVDACLAPVKKKFANITMNEVEEFRELLNDFHHRFYINGPSTVGGNLDKGLELLKVFQAELQQICFRRADLVSAEKLFDLPPTSYPKLVIIEKEMEGLTQVFDIYIEQQKAREEWSQTLWIDLNPQALIDGIEKHLRAFRKLPKAIKTASIGRTVEDRMKEFKSSIPLFVDLKNEALRERE